MHRPNQVRSLAFIALVFAFCACAPSTDSGPAPLPNLPTSTVLVSTQLPTVIPPTLTKPAQIISTPTPIVTVEPTATRVQLPWDLETENREYCQTPSVELLVSGAQGLSEDELTEKMVGLYLEYYNSPQAPGWCRIDGYQIDEVIPLGPGTAKQLEPNADFVKRVRFSVKLIQTNSIWIAMSGEIDQQNWLHTGRAFAITKVLNSASEEVYSMEPANP